MTKTTTVIATLPTGQVITLEVADFSLRITQSHEPLPFDPVSYLQPARELKKPRLEIQGTIIEHREGPEPTDDDIDSKVRINQEDDGTVVVHARPGVVVRVVDDGGEWDE